jgi:hypothetical protein
MNQTYIDDPFNNKIIYSEGQVISFKLTTELIGTGYIRGQSSTGLLPVWIVEVISCPNIDKATYPYTCIAVPSNCIDRKSL